MTSTGAVVEPDAPLGSYLRAKETVAHLLKAIERLVDEQAPWASGSFRDLLPRLGEDRFLLAVVGQFKRGKSTLMNAIVGHALLPTGTLPVTSAVTALRHGPAERAFVRRAGRSVDEEVPVATLPDFVTERGNPGNVKRVQSVDVEVPARFLRRGLSFVDTPGIGSAHERNTVTTLAFLPEADAALFVTSVNGPLSRAELDFLDAVRKSVRKLFFVLNKVDQVTAAERDEVVDYTRGLLSERLGVSAVPLFPVSAAAALAAGPDDVDALAASGLPALEAALAEFLENERRGVLLVRTLDRAIAGLDETRFALGLRQRALTDLAARGEGGVTELSRRLEELEEERRAVVAGVRERVARWDAEVLDPALARFSRELARALDDGPSSSREEIARRSAGWLAESAAGLLEEIARALGDQVRPRIGALLREPLRIASDILGETDGTTRAAEADAGEGWSWTAPAFDPEDAARRLTFHEEPEDASHVPLPRAWAARRASRRRAARNRASADRAASGLRSIALGYLGLCVNAIDVSSAAGLDEERRRVLRLVEPGRQGDDESRRTEADLAEKLSAFRALATTMRDALLMHEPLPLVPARAQVPVVAATSAGAAQVETKPRIVPRGTCPVCAAASDAVYRFLCRYQLAIAEEDPTRSQFLASRGLCPPHTWHLERVSSPRGLCGSYPRLLDETAERLRRIPGFPPETAAERLRELLVNAEGCAACGVRLRAETDAVARVSGELSGAAAPQGLCLAHLGLVLPGLSGDAAARLLASQARHLSDVSESMRECALKLDARRRSHLTEDESRAYRRGLVLLVGERYLFRTELQE